MEDSIATEGIEDTESGEELSYEDQEIIDTTPPKEDEDAGTDQEDEDPGNEDSDEDGEEDEQEEEIEISFGSEKLNVKKASIPEEVAQKLQDFTKGIHSSFTQKSQELSTQLKAVEERKQVFDKLTTLQDETLEIFSKGKALRQELEQLSGIDVNSLWQSDPDQARRVSDAIAQKQAEFQATVNEVNQREMQVKQQQTEYEAKVMKEGKDALDKRIPGFSEKHAPAVVEYAVSRGLPKEVAERWPMDPFAAEMTYKAMLFDRMQAKAKAKPKGDNKPVTPVKPSKGRGGRGANVPPSDPEQYRVWRQRQQAKSG